MMHAGASMGLPSGQWGKDEPSPSPMQVDTIARADGLIQLTQPTPR